MVRLEVSGAVGAAGARGGEAEALRPVGAGLAIQGMAACRRLPAPAGRRRATPIKSSLRGLHEASHWTPSKDSAFRRDERSPRGAPGLREHGVCLSGYPEAITGAAAVPARPADQQHGAQLQGRGRRGGQRRIAAADPVAGRPGRAEVARQGAPGYTTAPNRRPTPYVIAMARAPQKVTRTAPVVARAPPARAATAEHGQEQQRRPGHPGASARPA